MLILADGGGSNGARPRMWKKQLQTELANRLGITVTLCHYPGTRLSSSVQIGRLFLGGSFFQPNTHDFSYGLLRRQFRDFDQCVSAALAKIELASGIFPVA